ncbi:hypothetical protein CXG81DRAFT_20000 [Caulochytrium protostelioides]|uniref:Prephenate/arogenate dehydrogenase domain-containing protein n=1 Tax=Caulochytrium protostelioides TaxID=1555241 RepID=A0A4P9X4K4_9FUNG|nr:hypothetical protein CXG81DRAFT_20000 [Caulochytrium protostelioides]|eukprot:RKP00003.1 hypothetical protein CXG81DRAFT_20000 [Caulochytrium protostelioides]
MTEATPSPVPVTIGLIGLGDMGRLYARCFIKAGYTAIVGCDLPERHDELVDQFAGTPMQVLADGFAVARLADFLIFSVEASRVEAIVARYGPAVKVGATVCGQTSVKTPEIRAFEAHLPADTQIVTCHSLHGPRVNPRGQPLVVIRHRASDAAFARAEQILASLQSVTVYLSAEEHDHITADTQAVTHCAFLSMGSAWKAQRLFPWEHCGGIDRIKMTTCLRIYGSRWHVYAGLAIMNPAAKIQVQQYARSVNELFKLMLLERESELSERLHRAGEYVFGTSTTRKSPILLTKKLVDQFSAESVMRERSMPNSHLSLLAMVDCWHQLGIQPYDHLICQTPPFRLLLGMAEYLFLDEAFLNKSIHDAVHDTTGREADLEFYTAAQQWRECVTYETMSTFKERFMDVSSFFSDRLEWGLRESSAMIEQLVRPE